jgi:hypothetical protein
VRTKSNRRLCRLVKARTNRVKHHIGVANENEATPSATPSAHDRCSCGPPLVRHQPRGGGFVHAKQTAAANDNNARRSMTKLSKSTLPRSRWARVRERGQHALGARRDRPGHARTLSAEQRLPRRERIPWCERRRQGDASTLEPRARDAQPASNAQARNELVGQKPVPSTTLARGQRTTDADHRQQQESTSRTRWSARARGTFTRCKPTLAPET